MERLSVLLLNIPRSNLNKGQKVLVTLLPVKKQERIEVVAFHEKGLCYAYARMHGICEETLELVKIFTNDELGIKNKRRSKLEKRAGADDGTGTFINWDYPTCFDEPVVISPPLVSVFRTASPMQEKEIKEKVKEKEMEV